jgi:hypothetical protein
MPQCILTQHNNFLKRKETLIQKKKKKRKITCHAKGRSHPGGGG